MYPKTALASRFYGSPKLHKSGIPLRPIVDYTTSPTYALAKHIARILKPLEGTPGRVIKNSMELMNRQKNLTVNADECFVSFDISSLFTNVPVDESLQVIRQRLECDPTLQERTSLSVDDIITGTKLCIDSTYFKFRGTMYQQTEGLAMGSPISPIIAEIFMNDYENKMLACFKTPLEFGGAMLMTHWL